MLWVPMLDYSATLPASKGKKPPPIFIEAKFNWHVNLVRYKTIAPSLKSVSTRSALFLRLQTDSEHEYKALINLFNKKKVAYKSHNLNSDRPLKIIIRGLPKETSCDIIKAAVEENNFHVKSIVQLSSGIKEQCKPLSLFYVQIHKNEDFANFFVLPSCWVRR